MQQNAEQPVVKEVWVRILCPECRGAGMIMHPAWQMYQVAHGHILEPIDEEWFTEALQLKYAPDQNVSCWNCEGSGVISSWMSYEAFQDYVASIPAKQQI